MIRHSFVIVAMATAAAGCSVDWPLLDGGDAGARDAGSDAEAEGPEADATDAGTVGPQVIDLVPPAPGCLAISLAHDIGLLAFADLGHGTVSQMPATGGPPTQIAFDQKLATWQRVGDADYPAGPGPILLTHAGMVYWVVAREGVQVIGPGPSDGAERWDGGQGIAIMRWTPNGGTKAILPAELAPGPPITAIALSPDGKSLYFAAGTRFHRIPESGATTAADVEPVGATAGERGYATALVASADHLYYPSTDDGWAQGLALGAACADASAGDGCASHLDYSHAHPFAEAIFLRGQTLTFAEYAHGVATDLTNPGKPTFFAYASGGPLSGFAAGEGFVYYGIWDGPLNAEGHQEGRIEKAGPTPPSEPTETKVVVRGQPFPRSLVADGTHVFWTTSDCHVRYVIDQPQ